MADLTVNIPIIQQSINELEYIIKYISDNIINYNLSELTNNNMGDIPNIMGTHPLAIEYGNFLNTEDGENYKSILPAIGVELLDDSDYNQQFLGSGNKMIEITDTFLEELSAIEKKDRFEQGYILSDKNLQTIKTQKKQKGSEKLWANVKNYLKQKTVSVSIWSDNYQITRILYLVMNSILNNMKHSLSSEGVKNTSTSGQAGLYNYEFGQTLFGAEFSLVFINNHRDLIIQSNIETINKINLISNIENETDGIKFKTIGEE